MKKLLPAIFAILFIHSNAQENIHCGTDIMMRKIFQLHPEIKARFDQREATRRISPPNRPATTSYTIPIVFHILHLGGPENISDSQAIDAVRILNRDYAKQNSDTDEIIPAFKSIADSTTIHFVLATKDPAGNCTNGIVHYFDTDADWNDQSPTLYSYTWDPTKYLNVYVVRTITLSSGFGAAGYTYFPGTFASGDPYDAVVVLNNYFGSIGTSSVFQSRVLTHEVGHWFNLLHTFGFNSAAVDCSGDDFVDDTPTTPGYLLCPNAADSSAYQQCTPGVDENYQNYMDYSYCCRMFTHLQCQRMIDAVNDTTSGRNNLWTNSNLIETGVINPSSPCVPIADFTYDRSVTCVGAAVQFSDASWQGQPTSYNWSFPSGTPSTSSSPNPVVTYNASGTYSVTLTTSNASGTSSPVTKTNIITVNNNIASYQGSWFDGFETSPLPNNDWTLSNSSGGANWEQSFDASYSGFYSAEIPAASNTRNSVTAMISPSVNLSTIVNPELSFELAAKEINPAHINNLRILISTDCEETWTEIYNKTGSDLITTSDTSNPFIPFDQNEWRNEIISLIPFANATAANLKFVYKRDTLPTPSNIFIDDINIDIINNINDLNTFDEVKIYPNPSSGIATIELSILNSPEIKIDVSDMTGRIVDSIKKGINSTGIYHFYINKKTKGVYIVRINFGNHIITKKLVIQ